MTLPRHPEVQPPSSNNRHRTCVRSISKGKSDLTTLYVSIVKLTMTTKAAIVIYGQRQTKYH